ncbi:hypothetical protein BGLA2_220012 [Burkholderia gladioli]|nr:hypothetical protein BGLA2_220012 [Burkholderia gladioli]
MPAFGHQHFFIPVASAGKPNQVANVLSRHTPANPFSGAIAPALTPASRQWERE